MLYNGVSNRWRGWKSRQLGELGAGDGSQFRPPSLRKFDGAARSCSQWNLLGKNPELCFLDGNCFVHLCEKGQSQLGPAFKVPLGCLLDVQAEPLIGRFLDRSVSEEEACQNGHVDLYIPPSIAASQSQLWQYHVAIRNFLAWIFRRSLVGEHLGKAIVGLAHSMEEFREPGCDNIQGLLDYLDEEGYLDMSNHPDHAVAILHVAEVFQLRELYIDAFAHCVGMSEHLFKCSEFPYISLGSRKLIRRARADLDFRLSRAGYMLSDLLQEELSEAHVGLSFGARAHLERFRSLIHGLYVTKFGYYPPQPMDPRKDTIFWPEIYRSMKADFAALYEYLVDENTTRNDSTPPVAQGGLCVMQSVHEFDMRYQFTPMDHPLPLLPEPNKKHDSRRKRLMPWAFKEGKLRPKERLAIQAALVGATNHHKFHLLSNPLVMAYMKFEEDSISIQYEGKRAEDYRVDPADARKVRWLFIYAMYQTLRSCTEVPPEVSYATDVDYHMGVSVTDIPPWQTATDFDDSNISSYRNGAGLLAPCLPAHGPSNNAVPFSTHQVLSADDLGLYGGMEIKPDIDYFALTHQDEIRGRREQGHEANAIPRSRSQSLKRAISIRRSMSMFRTSSRRPSSSSSSSRAVLRPQKSFGGSTTTPQRPATSSAACATIRHVAPQRRNSIYQEIIVDGYGNGMNNSVIMPRAKSSHGESVRSRPASPPPMLSVAALASRSASTSSTSSHAVSVSSSAAPSTASTTPTTVVEPNSPVSLRYRSSTWHNSCTASPTATTAATTPPPIPAVVVPSMTSAPAPTTPVDESPTTTDDSQDNTTVSLRVRKGEKSLRNMYFNDDMLAAAPVSKPEPPSRRSTRKSRAPESKRWSLIDAVASLRDSLNDSSTDTESEMKPPPLRIRKPKHRSRSRARRRKTIAVDNINHDDEDEYRDSSDWERTLVYDLSDVSPPHTWEQFTDLGGFQPVHMLKK